MKIDVVDTQIAYFVVIVVKTAQTDFQTLWSFGKRELTRFLLTIFIPSHFALQAWPVGQ